MAKWRSDMRTVRPMLATLEDAPLVDPNLVYEPKYDGIRALVELSSSGSPAVRIWSRLGNEKTAQFPDLARALATFAATLERPLVLDGEVVALDSSGKPAGFQRLQNRTDNTRVAFIAFDVLRDGDDDLRSRVLTERRAHLEEVFGAAGSPSLRISDIVAGDGRALHRQARDEGWEGLIAKSRDSVYHTGRRTRDWRKLKLAKEQEFVVGGWTDARTTDRAFGALLLGYYRDGELIYAGHSGGGFSQRELERLARLMKPLEVPTSAFKTRPRTNERPHWLKPRLVAQVKFTEWTDDGLLRHPVYVGMRDDKKAETVTREDGTRATGARGAMGAKRAKRSKKDAPSARVAPAVSVAPVAPVLAQLESLERGRGGGVIDLPDGSKLEVTNLRKPFWPKLKITKGELLRYYVQVSPYIVPVVADRPLIMKRFPNGVDAQAFYQQRAPEKVQAGVRTASIPGDELPSRLIGGNLLTLLYMTQLAAISQDPWFSRAQSPHIADQCAIDLDPMPGVKFRTVIDTARWVRDELEKVGVASYPKTSGSRGIHIFIPLAPGTPYEAGLIFCQIIATMVAEQHPKAATVERAVRSRGKTVYVDYLQNIEGKSLACAYSARASDFAGASTPLAWDEVDNALDPRDFTIRTLPERLARTGDLWAPAMNARGADLRRVLERVARR